MHIFPTLAPLVLFSARLALGRAAPPNPDKLFALQQSAASVASTASSASETRYAWGGDNHHPRGEFVKRHHHVQAVHRGRAGRAGRVMEKRARGEAATARRLKARQKDSGSSDSSSGDWSSSSSDASSTDGGANDLEARAATQIPLANTPAPTNDGGASSASSSQAASPTSSSSQTSSKSSSSTSSSGGSIDGVWTGVSSYYLHAIANSDRYAILDAVKGAGFKVIRIFVASVGANNKGSNNQAVNDVEPIQVGTYDDTILTLIDQLMADCKDRGLKLMIALSDRYALGFWSTDSYATQLNIVKAGSSGVQQVADASSFYTSEWAIGMFDKRLAHIMNHQNQALGGKKWADLDDVIYAVEPQNEPQGHMAMASSTWACDRASYLKSLITSNILVSSGGGITLTDSLGSWATGCDAFDIVSVHDYGTSASSTANALAAAQNDYPGKKVIMGEWGIAGVNKAAIISQFVSAFEAKGVSWSYWEVTKPGAKATDFEVWTDEPAWQALTGQAYFTPVATTAAPASTSRAVGGDQYTSSKSPTWSKSSALSSKSVWHDSPSTTTSTPQWHAATSSFSSYVAKASSAASQGAQQVKSVWKEQSSKVAAAASSSWNDGGSS
ncbi:beta-1,3-mannanase [Rhodotorula toruloides]|uniref:Beta-1,3-mannanase n=1 Tax=Rhodotorula toruloides TaxID=5286 RepID=A0A511KE55_RHOTO|nr:beta-1,3-mannanase [Rhodotorula toruloides]